MKKDFVITTASGETFIFELLESDVRDFFRRVKKNYVDIEYRKFMEALEAACIEGIKK